MVVIEPERDKKAVNLTMPFEVLDEYLRLASDLGAKEKWMVVTAAMLMFIEADRETQRYYIGQVASAGPLRAWGTLVERAKAGELADQAGQVMGVKARSAAQKRQIRGTKG